MQTQKHSRSRQFGKFVLSGLLSCALVTGLAVTPAAADQITPKVRNTGSATSVDGKKVHYYEYGKSVRQAPTIFMTGTWPWHSGVFEPMVRLLAQRYHVVRFDPRGYGKSDHSYIPSDFTLEKLAGDFKAVVDRTVPAHKKFHVFGMEWGAFIFSEYNHLNPGRIVSFTSIGFPSIDIAEVHYRNTMKEGTPEEKVAASEFKAQAAMSTGLAMSPVLVDLALVGIFSSTNTITNESQGEYQAEISIEDAVAGRRAMMANMAARQLNPHYDFVDVPILQGIELTDDPFPTEFVLSGMHKYTNRMIYRKIKGLRTLLTTYPMTLTNWCHVAVQAGERIRPTV